MRRRSSRGGTNPTSRVTARISLIGALLAFALTLFDHSLPPFIPTIATTLAILAFVAGVSAQIMQHGRASLRAKRMLLISLPLSVITLALILVANRRERALMAGDESGEEGITSTAQISGRDTAVDPLFAPGWYGTLEREGLLVVVTSFDDTTQEARTFNGALNRPLHYATLTVINRSPLETLPPPTLTAITALHADNTETPAANLLNLLKSGPLSAPLRRQLDDATQPLAPGAMVANLPLGFPTTLNWRSVVAVGLTLGGRPLLIQGRLLTSAEKRALLDAPPNATDAAATNAPSATTTAEEWFKGL